jgi:hypothetical protein
LNKLPNSDYCFSVIHTWLAYGGPVEYSELNPSLLLLKYVDVLDNDLPIQNFTLIGDPNTIKQKDIELLIELAKEKTSKVIISEAHAETISSLVPDGVEYVEEDGLTDYLYSVDDYSNLDKPDFRRIRREIRTFHRLYEDTAVSLEEVDLSEDNHKWRVINTHHTWDDTFRFGNDPERTEGIIIARSIELAEHLELKGALIKVNNKVEGVLIYTVVQMNNHKYADLHHARFSYRHKYLNDYAFHLFALHLEPQKFDYINFERDADVPGLRKHKLLLKPAKTIKAGSLRLAQALSTT